MDVQIYFCSENCLSIELINPNAGHSILGLKRFLDDKVLEGHADMVPTFETLNIFFDSGYAICNNQLILTRIKSLVSTYLSDTSEAELNQTPIEIPVCYDQSLSEDWGEIIRLSGLRYEDIIHKHLSTVYQVKMIGFTPGFPYMGIVDQAIRLQRKPNAGQKVIAGSVGIAEAQTGIYPFDIYGGWYILGRTPLQIFVLNREDPFLLKPGDWVRFKQIDLDTFWQMKRNEHA